MIMTRCSVQGMRHIVSGIFLLLVLFLPDAWGGDNYILQPVLTLSEEYNDNILLQRSNKEYDTITRVDPSIYYHYNSSLWTWDANYTLDYRLFSEHSQYDGTSQYRNLRNLTEVVDNFFFVEAIDDYQKVSTDITTDYTQQSLLVNQIDQHIFTLHPYLVVKASSNTALEFGHTYRDTQYTGEGIDRIDNIDYLEAQTKVTSNLTSTIGTRHTRELNSIQNFDQLDVYAGLQYTYADKSSLYGTLGRSWFDYQITGKTSEDFWSAGINHKFSTVTVSAETAVNYIQDPQQISTRQYVYSASMVRDSPRSNLTLVGALKDYKNIAGGTLVYRSHEAQGAYRYYLTPRTTGILGIYYQDLEYKTLATHTYLSLSNLRIEHLLAEKITLGTEYRYLNSYSPLIATNCYTNNRAIVDLKIQF